MSCNSTYQCQSTRQVRQTRREFHDQSRERFEMSRPRQDHDQRARPTSPVVEYIRLRLQTGKSREKYLKVSGRCWGEVERKESRLAVSGTARAAAGALRSFKIGAGSCEIALV